jgi:uncharacterized protein YacL
MSNVIKNVLIFGGLIVLAIFGYYLFVLQDDSVVGVASNDVDIASVAERESFLRSLQELKSIKLDTSVLNDERFVRLVDYSNEPQEVPVGRSNPFANPN